MGRRKDGPFQLTALEDKIGAGSFSVDPMMTRRVRLFCLLSCAHIRFSSVSTRLRRSRNLLHIRALKDFAYFFLSFFETFLILAHYALGSTIPPR